MSNSSSNNGVSGLGLLGTAFVVLKLANVIDWSWWYVTLPFWGGIVLVLIGLVVYLIIRLIAESFKNKNPNKKSKEFTYPKNSKAKKSKFQKRLDELAEKRNN